MQRLLISNSNSIFLRSLSSINVHLLFFFKPSRKVKGYVDLIIDVPSIRRSLKIKKSGRGVSMYMYVQSTEHLFNPKSEPLNCTYREPKIPPQ